MAVSDTTLHLRGLTMHVRDWGGTGRPVVLVHGLASNARIWDLVAPLLAERPMRIVAIDQRGHGETDKPSHGYGFTTITGDLHHAVQALVLARPLVVGHSWGASVALHYAARHPHDVSGVVCVDGGFFDMARAMTWEEAQMQMAPPDLTSLTAEEFLERARNWGSALTWDEATVGAVMGNFYVAQDGRIRPHLSRENHMRILHAMYHDGTAALLPRVRCHVLLAPVIWEGRPPGQDVSVRKRAAVERALAALPRAEVRWFEESIHDLPLQRPREMADAIAEFAEKI